MELKLAKRNNSKIENNDYFDDWQDRVKPSLYLLIYVKWLKSCDVLALYLHYAVLHILTKMVTYSAT